MCPKQTVYFIEGLPGCGKTTISKWLQLMVEGSKLLTEGDADYPNNFGGIAGMTADIYRDFSKRYPVVQPFSFEQGSIKYVNARAAEEQYLDEPEFIHALKQWDIGDEFNQNVTVPHYITCSLGLIRRWVNSIEYTNSSLIMDSVILQNPLNELLFRNADEQSILDYCQTFVRAFDGFNTVCIYLKRKDAQRAVEFASSIKGNSWTKRVEELISRTPYGIAHHLHGHAGMIQYFSARMDLEEKLLSLGIMNNEKYDVDNLSWDQVHKQIESNFLKR